MNRAIRSYRDLITWQRGRALVRATYEATALFPADEKFGLTSQMRRAAISVISNIAEGYGRGSKPDYLRFLRVARGSLFELESQCIIAEDLGFMSTETAQAVSAMVAQVARPLSGLIQRLESQVN